MEQNLRANSVLKGVEGAGRIGSFISLETLDE